VEAAAGVPITDNVGLISKDVETLFKSTEKNVPDTYYSELYSILDDNDIITLINIPDEGHLNDNITNLKSKLDPITKQKQLHWDFNTRHFYWTPNKNDEDKTVLIKYYPRFGDPNDISVYKLLTANTFEPFIGEINTLLPEKPVAPVPAPATNTN